MMQGSFATVVDSFRATLSTLRDKRTGKNSRYEMLDAGLSAFSVFFTQTPSFLAHQRKMSQAKGLSNAQTLFGVHQIPSDNHIRDLLMACHPLRYILSLMRFFSVSKRRRSCHLFGHLRQFTNVDRRHRVREFHENSLCTLFNKGAQIRRDALLSYRCHPRDYLSWPV